MHFLPLLLLGERIHVERQLMAAETNDQFAEESWPGIRTDTDILAPLMSLDRNAPPKANSRVARVEFLQTSAVALLRSHLTLLAGADHQCVVRTWTFWKRSIVSVLLRLCDHKCDVLIARICDSAGLGVSSE